MSAGIPFSAVNAAIRVGSTVIFGANWSVKENPEMVDVSNFEGGGFSDTITGMYTCTADIECYFDGGQNQFDTPPNLGAGSIGATLKLFTNTTSGPFWLFPLFVVTSTETSAEAKGNKPVWFKFSIQNKGGYFRPTGNSV